DAGAGANKKNSFDNKNADDARDATPDIVVSTDDAPSSPVDFAQTDAILMNPERGFYVTADLAKTNDFAFVRTANKTIMYAAVHLDKYLGMNHAQDLPPNVMTNVQAGFDAVRRAGVKAVVRFQYDDGEGYPSGANDAPETWMIRHIQQLAPVLQKNE